MVVVHIFIVRTTQTARQLLRGVGALLPNPRVAPQRCPLCLPAPVALGWHSWPSAGAGPKCPDEILTPRVRGDVSRTRKPREHGHLMGFSLWLLDTSGAWRVLPGWSQVHAAALLRQLGAPRGEADRSGDTRLRRHRPGPPGFCWAPLPNSRGTFWRCLLNTARKSQPVSGPRGLLFGSELQFT